MTLRSIILRRRCAPVQISTWLKSRTPCWCVLAVLAFQLGANYHTANFAVTAATPELAREVGAAAEHHRRRLAIEWFGDALPDWDRPCPISVDTSHRKAYGSTSCLYRAGRALDWRMALRGPRERILAAVLPHEVGHTVLSTHFGRPLPRWVEEGICASIEDEPARAALQWEGRLSLLTGKAMNIQRLLALADYPADASSFYAQGYSLTQFLLDQGGPRKLLRCIGDAISDDDWQRALHIHYGYRAPAELQTAWQEWLLAASVGLGA